MSLLELENVVVAYGKVEALKGVTLRVEQGEIVVLLGSNGAGKSTTLRTISGLTHPLLARCVSLTDRSIGSRLR
jgi:branched-chain amino acid transport system ATP-binding protein